MTDEKDARKLFDLQNFAIYWDTEVLGDLEGEELVVSCVCCNSCCRQCWGC